jgi:hypothetical protein
MLRPRTGAELTKSRGSSPFRPVIGESAGWRGAHAHRRSSRSSSRTSRSSSLSMKPIIPRRRPYLQRRSRSPCAAMTVTSWCCALPSWKTRRPLPSASVENKRDGPSALILTRPRRLTDRPCARRRQSSLGVRLPQIQGPSTEALKTLVPPALACEALGVASVRAGRAERR